MKTLIFFLTTILLVSYTFISASNPSFTKEKIPFTKSEVHTDLLLEISLQLAPVTPPEASFEDNLRSSPAEINSYELKALAPEIPQEASFDDDYSADTLFTRISPPAIPCEATFDDPIEK